MYESNQSKILNEEITVTDTAAKRKSNFRR